MKDGTVKTAGYNGSGQLATGNTTNLSTPTAIASLTGVKQVACAQYTSYFLLNDGTVKGVGSNGNGELGQTNTTNPMTTICTILTGVKQIACGGNHTMIVFQNGSLKATGVGTQGQITGTSSVSTAITPVASGVKSAWDFLGKLLKFLFQSGSKYYTYANGWSEVAGEPTEDTFKTSGLDSIANIPATAYASLTDPQIVAFTDEAAPPIEIEGRKDFLALCSSSPEILAWTDDVETPLQLEISGDKNLLRTLDAPINILGWTDSDDAFGSVKVTATPKPVLIMPTGDLRLNGVERIDRFELTAVRAGNGVVKVIVSVNQGETWHAYHGEWTEIIPEQAGEAGMTPEVMSALNASDWGALRGGSDTIRFAYYLEVSDPTDVAATDKLESQFDMHGYWVVANSDRYRVEYPSQTKMTVLLYQDGSYKINYT